jgi:serine/threonine-protein kinase HipA
MSILHVFYENKKVGSLERDEELTFSFKYSEEWIKSPSNFPLSLIMPVDEKTYGNKLTLSFFENLLPEGDVRNALEKSQDVHGDFEFLAKYGRDCAGALVITPDENFKQDDKETKLEEISLEKVYKAIEERRPVADMIAETNSGYLSLAGAQDKFPIVLKNKKFFMPLNGTPTTHIVKVPIWRNGVKDSVYNEYYCMELARAVGFKVPHCFIEKGEHPLYVIERYDRSKDKEGVVHRIHQQDFCQAQGIVSEFKYEAKGGPSLKDNYDLIVKNVMASKKFKAINSYLDWVMFNLLIGNNDSHSKNISFLMINNKIELAPMYDLISTAIYPKLKREFSFIIGDRDVFSRIGKNQFELLEVELDIKKGTLMEVLQKMNDKIMKHKDIVAKEIIKEHGRVPIISNISKLIEKRSRSLIHQKALSGEMGEAYEEDET